MATAEKTYFDTDLPEAAREITGLQDLTRREELIALLAFVRAYRIEKDFSEEDLHV